MSKNNGGPAFPGLHPSKECTYKDSGMTLRDYFAAKAMQGLLQYAYAHADRASVAYKVADAMLAEREKDND